jgi:DNA-binding LacI/PurR family transcriptional regulator
MTDLARGVEDRADEAGYSVIICSSDEDGAKEDAYLTARGPGVDDRQRPLRRRGQSVS